MQATNNPQPGDRIAFEDVKPGMAISWHSKIYYVVKEPSNPWGKPDKLRYISLQEFSKGILTRLADTELGYGFKVKTVTCLGTLADAVKALEMQADDR